MRAIQAQEFGGPEVLKPVELDPPEPAAGEAVVAVHAVDVLGLDIAIRSGDAAEFFGIEPPYVPGDGVAGTVVAAGNDVDRQLVGRRVVTTTGTQGACAERVAVPAEDLVTVPDGLGLTAAAALVHDGRTALALIEAAAVRSGERVLVVPSGSGLGLMLVQLARLAGGTVIAAARGTEQLAAATVAGAARVVDAASSDWTVQLGEPVNVVLDGVGDAIGRAAFELVASGGRYLSYSGEPGPEPDEARRRGVTPFGTEVVHLGSSGATPRLTERVLGEAAAGRIRPVVGPIFPLEGAAEAHTAFEGGGLVGRTLITVAEVDAMADHDELIGLVERFGWGFAAADAELLTALWAGDEDSPGSEPARCGPTARSRGTTGRRSATSGAWTVRESPICRSRPQEIADAPSSGSASRDEKQRTTSVSKWTSGSRPSRDDTTTAGHSSTTTSPRPVPREETDDHEMK